MPDTASEDASDTKATLDFLPDEPREPETTIANGHDAVATGDEPPLKKRRVSESTPVSAARKKQVSPPWKKIIAEGPSSFTQDGKRKSGRTNHIPLELQPPSDKRQTRGAVHKNHPNTSAQTNGTNGKASLPAGSQKTTLSGKKSTRGENQQTVATTKSASSPKRSYKASHAADTSPTPVRTQRPNERTRRVVNGEDHKQSRRSARTAEMFGSTTTNGLNNSQQHGETGEAVKSPFPRIRLRVKPPTLPIAHPEMILRRPKQYPTFKEFVENASNVPIENGGFFAAEEDVRYTQEMARRDAQLLLRMEEAAEEGGVLSLRLSSAYKPDEMAEKRNFLKQYGHQDHLVRAMTGFRQLMVEELKNHKRTAKRLAEACRDEWSRKQPKTLHEIEAEAMKIAQARYRFLVKTLQATWDNVKVEVNRRRIKEWEAEEQIRVRKALNDAVDISTQKLEARQGRGDSEPLSDEDESGDESMTDNEESHTSNTDSDSNISSSDSEAEEEEKVVDNAGDEHLTVEELRLKYSNIPEMMDVDGDDSDLDSNIQSAVNHDTNASELLEDSDESIDMDDDMGSSDDDRDSEDDEDASEDEDDDEEEAGSSGLLGFLAPSERVSNGILQTDTMPTSVIEQDGDEEPLDEDDEVSLIPVASHQPHIHVDKHTIIEQEVIAEEIDPSTLQSSPERDIDLVSGDRSSQPTPRTTETKVSEIDSASSIELHQSSRNATHSATPQPTNRLKTPIPFLLRGTLREYQHYGLDWLAGLYANNTNGILADEMGLGKTIQTISLLAHLACEHQVWGPHLVIVPTSVILNWEIEFKKFLPGFKVLTYYGNQDERRRKRMGWLNDDAWNVVITSYQIVVQDAVSFKKRKWHYMILDEAHNIKNFRSQRWQTLLTFNTRARLLLTGTPLQNNLTELWSLLFFLMPSDGTEQTVGGFADLKEFSDWFRKPQEQILENGRETMDDEARAIISKLHKVLRPYLLRRMKADVEKQMPLKYEHVEYCRLSRRQRELYDGFLSRSDTRETLGSGNYLSIINCLMQLRKVCNHPDLFQERPIMSSYPMKRSAVADFEIKDLLVRRKLLREDPMTKASLSFLNLIPTKNENLSGAINERSSMLTAQRVLMDMREAQRTRAKYALTSMDPSTVKSNLVYLESASRWSRFEELQHIVYLNALRRQQKPIYGSQLVELLDFGVSLRPLRKQPDRPEQKLDWLEASSSILKDMVRTVAQRSEAMDITIQKFACITSPILAPDILPMVLTRKTVEYFQTSTNKDKPDPFHEARMRLSVQFPDKRLLQYDCGKLQALAKLLRKLESGGHRALIFTQMVKVLDILEQFLNIHGHKYLRLDGSTKVEQRQILTDRFNKDTRILAFILSSRSGGLGLNLTGADTVIFYDLDWNPAMDKQCTDRAHRIGQTRDVHIYRLVSEHTIEANILRKANQKRMLDDVVIQEGEFTTDYFNKLSSKPILEKEEIPLDDDAAAASAAMDRVLGGPSDDREVQRILEQAEDQEDVVAAREAEKEMIQTDAADFDERLIAKTPGQDTPMEDAGTPNATTTLVTEIQSSGLVNSMDMDEEENNAWGEPIASTDDYMLRIMTAQLKDTPLDLPKDKRKSKKGKDHRNRAHRPR